MSRFELPPAGHLIHGVFPSGFDSGEQAVLPEHYNAYVQAAGGRRPIWIYFSHEWGREPEQRRFPEEIVRRIHDWNAVPFVRLMLRSSNDTSHTECEYTLDRINAGCFDRDLWQWGRAAARFIHETGRPLICEWGTEANGDWFHWSPQHWLRLHSRRGATEAQALQLFVCAYERIIDQITCAAPICRDIRWVLHFNQITEQSAGLWDRFDCYELKAKRIDWYGASVYGAQHPQAAIEFQDPFESRFERLYQAFRACRPERPVLLCEYGCTHNIVGSPEVPWCQQAFESLLRRTADASNSWTNLRGVSWWNEGWSDESKGPTEMRMQCAHADVQRAHQQFLSNGRVLSQEP